MSDPEIFFPQKNNLKAANEALTLCFSCPVRAECRQYKLQTGSDWGIWAGEFSKRDD